MMGERAGKFPRPSGRSVVRLVLVFAVAFILSLEYSGGGSGLAPAPQDVEVVELVAAPACDPTRTFCNALGGEVGLGLRLGPSVRTLEPFAAQVRVRGLPPTAVSDVQVKFVMRDMDMGDNRYRLSRQGDGLWHGRITLPVCTSGRIDWQATVRVAAGKTVYTAHFPFKMR